MTMSIHGAGQTITAAVQGWEGVTTKPHRFGGTEYLLGTREIGHVHGDTLVDIPFPTRVKEELVAAGDAMPHHVLPESGWVSFYVREPEDVAKATALLRRSYELAVEQRARAKARDAR
jgi:hypothetical protein